MNQHIFKVLFDETVFDKRFLRLAINQNLDDYIRQAHGAAGLAHITKRKFEESELICPPLSEQNRIVAEIEKQFTRLDAGVASLRRVQAALKRYRASVLKAACEGRLVPIEAELARREARTYESGLQLLARIQEQRRIQSQAARLSKSKRIGAELKDEMWKIKDPDAPRTSVLEPEVRGSPKVGSGPQYCNSLRRSDHALTVSCNRAPMSWMAFQSCESET